MSINPCVSLREKEPDPISTLRVGWVPRNLAIAFGDVKHEKFYIIVKHWICKIRKTYPNQYVLLKRINMKKYI